MNMRNRNRSIFDEVIDRTNTMSIKYDYAAKLGVPEDALPMWVADMDFRSPACVNEALAERCRHGLYGYSDASEAYYEAVRNWFFSRHGWEIDVRNIVTAPGVVFAIHQIITALTKPGDSVLIQRPVYYPFSSAVTKLGRNLVNNALVRKDGRYEIDFEDFEKKISDKRVKLFILSNPHNPVGRVWTREELLKMSEILLRHGVYVIADEIHEDFIYEDHRHTVFSTLSPEIADLTVTCTAPSKTFNLAGLQISNLVITNDEIRRRYKDAVKQSGYSQPNLMGILACRAAYENGAPWLDELIRYLSSNIVMTKEILARDFPGVRLTQPEGTYLLWLDFSELGLSDDELNERIEKKGRVWLDPGPMFGPEGSGFQRVNIACPSSVLWEGLNRMRRGLYE